MPCKEGLLPHQHEDLETRFPQAEACEDCEEIRDVDPLELGGRVIGESRRRLCHRRTS